MSEHIKSVVTWTAEIPTAPGWYFARDKYENITVLRVARMPDGELIVGGTIPCSPLTTFLYSFSGEWAGPIPEPT